ncbi:hypothetical protein MTR67_027367 [Solanum verrucosum]|uniref:Uncharacterized protein n=1 Tax=Solanum verrucosum TaxID=315347 RepID=A0AAF0TUS8_SOLVR|nr:hypothetical protein MTR67_027367 [Solanum verrucosum]
MASIRWSRGRTIGKGAEGLPDFEVKKYSKSIRLGLRVVMEGVLFMVISPLSVHNTFVEAKDTSRSMCPVGS